ncbi:MAG: hypothetical protein J6C51_05155 [Clostridia bacterium]|nr:hypothetical protein [Clostridia bacterium]
MNDFPALLFSLSLKASWAVLAVLFMRLLLKSAPKWTHCFLWAVVALRLILPFSTESVLSLVPSREVVETVMLAGPLHSLAEPETVSALTESGADILHVLGLIWFVGATGLLLYAAFSYYRMYRRIAVSVELEKRVYLCDDIDKPFIFGVFNPRICLPSDMPEEQRAFVILHERAHLKRGDHIWKPLSFLLLALHWFNPLLWLSYKLFGQDVELACDEATVKNLDLAERRAYSETLLLCGMERKMRLLCPVAFGEIGIQERIVSVLSYRKQTRWRALTASAMCVVLAVCLLTDPVTAAVTEEITDSAEETASVSSGWIGTPSVEFTDADYVFTVEDDISINANGISIAELKCCPYVHSAGMELSYTMKRNGSEDLYCRYGSKFHSHRTGYIYAVVRCKNCGSDIGSYYVGRGYYCEYAEQILKQ